MRNELLEAERRAQYESRAQRAMVVVTSVVVTIGIVGLVMLVSVPFVLVLQRIAPAMVGGAP